MMNSTPTNYPDGTSVYWTLDYQWAEENDDDYHGCRDGVTAAGVPFNPAAMTTTWPGLTSGQMIRVCPMYLSYIAAKRFWSSSQVTPGQVANRRMPTISSEAI